MKDYISFSMEFYDIIQNEFQMLLLRKKQFCKTDIINLKNKLMDEYQCVLNSESKKLYNRMKMVSFEINEEGEIIISESDM